MSLSPFDSFQSRFVTYLLDRPRILTNTMENFIKYYKRVTGVPMIKT